MVPIRILSVFNILVERLKHILFVSFDYFHYIPDIQNIFALIFYNIAHSGSEGGGVGKIGLKTKFIWSC